MLNINDLHVAYGDIQVVWGVSFTVPEHSIVALLGPNGAGKTTTLRAILGLLPSQQGEVTFLGEPITHRPTHKIVESGLVLVPEGSGVFATLNVLENLELGAFTSRARPHKEATMAQVFDIFPRLAERKRQRAGTLSGGERRMLAIGRALMCQPKLLILDEPSLGLAPLIVEDIFGVIQRISQQGVSILIVEQNVHLTLEVAEHAYIIENGRIVQHDSGANLLKDERVKESYLGL